nr:hypothetical chloroplast RF47 [Dinophyceae sp. MRD-151]
MRLLFSFFLVRFILPQTIFDNIVINSFNDTGFFANYTETKSKILSLVWRLILVFFYSPHLVFTR